MSIQNPNLAPGEKLSSRAKEALARDNARETLNAHEMAARHREDDMRSGRIQRTDQLIADSIKGKLEREEFHKK